MGEQNETDDPDGSRRPATGVVTEAGPTGNEMIEGLAEAAPPNAEDRVAVLKHRRASRWMHWINFPLLTIMIWSGLRIYWADLRDPFGFGVGLVGWHWFDFFPEFITEPLGLERKLARGMAFHFTFGWLFALNGLAYGIYTWRSGEWRHLLPDRYSARDSVAVVKHDLFIGDRKLPPQGRYNGAQRWSYTLIVVMGAIAVLTGLAIYKPTQLNLLTTLFGGYESARTIHFFVTIGFLAFFVLHILQVVRAGWANFASMVTGYELQPAGAGSARSTAARSAVESLPTMVDENTDTDSGTDADTDSSADTDIDADAGTDDSEDEPDGSDADELDGATDQLDEADSDSEPEPGRDPDPDPDPDDDNSHDNADNDELGTSEEVTRDGEVT